MASVAPPDPELTGLIQAFAKGIGLYLDQQGSGLQFILLIGDLPDGLKPQDIRLAYASSMDAPIAVSLLQSFVTAAIAKLAEDRVAGHA